jgi:hypothetical protein
MNSINELLADRAADLFTDDETAFISNDMDFNSPSEERSEQTPDEQSNSLNSELIDEINNFNDSNETTLETNFTPPVNKTIDIEAIKQNIYSIKNQLDGILRMLGNTVNENSLPNINLSENTASSHTILPTGEKIIEGVFNGYQMIGSDGLEYSVPPNYASKSKLLEGDIMKLTITTRGAFIYKQIGPIERRRVLGELVSDVDNDHWSVLAEGKTYKILKASVTFYKGTPGSEVVLLLPVEGGCTWAAVDNII